MSQPWYIRFGWWLCEKTGHLGRIVSEPIKKEKA
jgi:hypothetical protein